ncbi:hypothetical protein UlMin_012600 [Ulmus minor]
MDVRTAFLNGDLYEDVYMTQPMGLRWIDGKEHLVFKLKKCIYGLKQASRLWYLKFDKVVTINGFKENIVDQCIYTRVSGSSYIFLMLYVDDILLTSCDTELLFETKEMLFCHFDMKDLGDASYALIIKGEKLSKAQCPRNDDARGQMKMGPYASMIGSLMYTQVCCMDDKKSSTGYTFMMARGAISLKSVKQTLTTSSTKEPFQIREFWKSFEVNQMQKNLPSHLCFQCLNLLGIMDPKNFVQERLDHLLWNDEWSSLFSKTIVNHLKLWGSDHGPLLVKKVTILFLIVKKKKKNPVFNVVLFFGLEKVFSNSSATMLDLKFGYFQVDGG